MDFKFRAVDEQPSNDTPQPSPSYNPLSYHGFRPDFILNGTQLDPVVLREWEKAQIREEIIASEIARRRALEAEVRRELAAKWEMEAIIRARQTAGSLSLMPHFNNHHRWRPELRFNLFPPPLPSSLPLTPFPSPPVTEVLNTEVTDTSEEKKDKLIILAKPDLDPDPVRVLGEKRKTPPLAETSELPLPSPSISSNVKQQKKWICAVCQVSSTCEKGLTEHLQGKNHKRSMEKKNNTITLQKEELEQEDQKLEDKETIIKNEKDELLIEREEVVERFMKKIYADSPEKKHEPTAIHEVEETKPELSKKKKLDEKGEKAHRSTQET